MITEKEGEDTIKVQMKNCMLKHRKKKIFPRLSADECAACKKDERDMRTSVRWTERQKYGKIL